MSPKRPSAKATGTSREDAPAPKVVYRVTSRPLVDTVESAAAAEQRLISALVALLREE